jgi:hypothetical protein
MDLITILRKASVGVNFTRGYLGWDYRNDVLNERESKTKKHQMRIPLY